MTLWAHGIVACSQQGVPLPSRRDAGAKLAPELTAVTAIRCAECHSGMGTEWETSAHARAASSPAYLAMKTHAPAKECVRCHQPLLGLVDPQSLAIQEGVTCEVCHSMTHVRPARGGAGFELALSDNVKYGPWCDLKDHYFHKMGCSPVHAESTQCAGCHLYYVRTSDGDELPVYTEYEEWTKSSAFQEETPCQGCHMPEHEAEIAVGAPKRPGISHHAFLGTNGAQRQDAVRGELQVASSAGEVQVTVSLRNRGAGHAVPTGLPGRRMVLTVESLDDEGHPVDIKELIYARILVDRGGIEVPFYSATHLLSDTRLMPDERRVETFNLHAASRGRIRAELRWHELGPTVANALGVTLGPGESMAVAEVAFGAMTRHGRKLLPRTEPLRPSPVAAEAGR